MDGRTQGMLRGRLAWRHAARTAAVLSVVGTLALTAAACSSGSPSSAGAGGSPSATGPASSRSAVGYASCIRSHGIPNYPDPSSNGTLPKTSAQHLGVSSSQYQAARSACQHLLPTTEVLSASSLQQCYLADVCPQALVQHAMSAGRTFARCMRSHGAPNWPDPSIDSEGRPLFNINVPRPPPPQVSTAINECSRLQHAGSLLAWG